MSLPDGAEYWQDVKSGSNSYRYQPTHSTFAKCHLRGNFYTHDASRVDCHFCIALMTPEVLEKMAKAHANNLGNREHAAKKKFNKVQSKGAKAHGLGLCKCGHYRVKRVQRATGTPFKACSNYPICKITENY